MSKLEKLLEKIKNNPKAVRFDELEKPCVPFRQPHVLRIYVELAIELIGDCFGEPEGESDEEGF